MDISLKGIGAGMVYLQRGDSFKVKCDFDYIGAPQGMVFELSMRHDTMSADPWHIVGNPKFSVLGAKTWEPVSAEITYKVPSSVVNGDQNIRMRMIADDKTEENSGVYVNVIRIT